MTSQQISQIQAEYKAKFQITLTPEQAEIIRQKISRPVITRETYRDRGRLVTTEKINGFRI